MAVSKNHLDAPEQRARIFEQAAFEYPQFLLFISDWNLFNNIYLMIWF
jgi:hypothetical protein